MPQVCSLDRVPSILILFLGNFFDYAFLESVWDVLSPTATFRIGQTKDVKIYRLITRNTYEERLFECSSRKYGLDEAILGNRVGAEVNLDHDKNIESLLKHGAYDIMKVLSSIIRRVAGEQFF